MLGLNRLLHLDRGSRPLWRVLLIAAAAATLAAVPARAEHVPHWYENGALIVGSVSVEARGTMRFTAPEVRPNPGITCRDVVADWTLTNPSGGEAGIGELTSLTANGCRVPSRGCNGASAEIGGLPQRAPLKGRRPLAVTLEGVEWSAKCSTGEIRVRGEPPLFMTTRRGAMHVGEGGECETVLSCHPAAAAFGRLNLASNITAK